MPGLVPGIHVLGRARGKAWMAGTSPAMTNGESEPPRYSLIRCCNRAFTIPSRAS
ncbi:hypothetical protein ABIA95_007752 [Bradyrhizobium sp. LA8.1]